MTYDGVFIKAQIKEILNIVKNEHIAKITESTSKEVQLHIRKNGKNFIFSLSAEPNFPHILLSENNNEYLYTPPSFCMLLRKYLNAGIIKDIKQINNLNNITSTNDKILERIVCIEIENIDETGEIATYYLFIEIMGKYSNIIITKANLEILDVLIKSEKSDNRLKVKNQYSIEKICNKEEILIENEINFIKTINNYKTLCDINKEKYSIQEAICKSYAGISKNLISKYMIDEEINNDAIELDKLKNYINNKIQTTIDTNNQISKYINTKLTNYFDTNEKKNIEKIIKNLYINLNKKLDIYKNELNKCKDLSKYKTYGDLIASFGYDKSLIKDNLLICEDYTNNNEKIEIPLDITISISENIDKYYNKYNKLKRTKENAEALTNETIEKLSHLDTIKNALSFSNDKNDLYLIKEELTEYFNNMVKTKDLHTQKQHKKARDNIKGLKNKFNYNIHHYKSSEGIDIYVGKNNLQNEYLTFNFATNSDTWLHIKNATGSHVIIKKPYTELTNKTLVEAASLAAYFSEKKNETKATVDYTLRKELKKVKGKAPGFCIYHKNYSINVRPEILIKEI